MARLTAQESEKRKQEIIDACEKLYQTKDFKDINIFEISRLLTFTRTSIYNYFDSKEEIFLALLQREYLKWESDLREILSRQKLTKADFTIELAESLAKRQVMLKLLALNMTDLDSGSRLENLVAFKKAYGQSLILVRQILEKFFPDRSEQANTNFIFSFFPFIYGIYPYTSVTSKQKEAMTLAEVPYVYLSVRQIVESCINNLLK